jgi:hypothetical protein
VFLVGTARAEEVKTSVDFGMGYRTDEVDWTISTPSINPLSELEWSSLDIIFAKSTVRMSYKKFYARSTVDYGRIFGGDNRDSDWALSGRQAEFSRSNNNGDTGSVFDASIGVGYEIPLGKFTLIPLVGYSWHTQHLEMTNGVQTIATPGLTLPLGPFDGLHSTYNTLWHGPWVGVDLHIQPSDTLRFFTTFEYHHGDYEGEGYWNLRNAGEGMGFKHLADAKGIVIAGGFAHAIKDTTDIGLRLEYTDWESEEGAYTIHNVPGTNTFNEANWKSFSVMFNAQYRFYELNQGKTRFKDVR